MLLPQDGCSEAVAALSNPQWMLSSQEIRLSMYSIMSVPYSCRRECRQRISLLVSFQYAKNVDGIRSYIRYLLSNLSYYL